MDNQSTVNVFINGQLLRNIRTVRRKLTIYSTGGKSVTRQVGDLPGFGEVWYHPNGIANILSLALVKKRFQITYDSHSDNTFHVHLGNKKFEDSMNPNRASTTPTCAQDLVCLKIYL